jgi:hypothetical protein
MTAARKISALPDCGPLAGVEHLPLVQGSSTVRATLDELPLSTAVVSALALKLNAAEKAAVSGVASLDASALIPAAQMRAFADRGYVLPSTTYNRWDLATYRGRRILFTIQTTTSSATTPFVTAANYLELGRLDVWSAYDYGYRADGTQATATANNAAITAAITAAYNSGGGVVTLPPGQGYINSTIALRQFVYLEGQGLAATYLRLADNSNCDMVKSVASPGAGTANASMCGVRNLKLDGNSSQQTSGTCHGIYFTTNPLTAAQTGTSGYNGEWFDMHHVIDNVQIHNVRGDGVHLAGRSAIQLSKVWVDHALGYGYYSTFDTHFTHCEADAAGLAGFYVNNASVRMAACKAYLCGQVDGVGAGFEFASNCQDSCLAACEAQNNAGPGFLLTGVSGANIHGVADSNSFASVNYAAVELSGSSNNTINVTSRQTMQGGVQVGHQSYALKLTGTCAASNIDMTHSGQVGTTIGAAIHPSSVALASNSVRMNGVSLTNTLAVLTDVALSAPTDGQLVAYDAATGKFKNSSAGSSAFTVGTFGDGSDGAATLDGTATVAWATLAGSVYTMSRDCFCTTLVVNAGVTLVPRGGRIFCSLNLTNNGTIGTVGNDGTATAGGATVTGFSGSVLTAGIVGGAGGITAVGTSGQNGGYGVGNGGAGGAGASTAGGAAGGGTGVGTSVYRTPQPALIGWGGGISLKGAGTGGGGGGDGTNRGGGGGGAGSPLIIFAKAFTNAGTLTARGGNGFTPLAGNCGGGGSAGGSQILIYTLTAWTNTGTTVTSAGTPGAGVGTGTAGATGSTGTVFAVTLA